MILTVNCYLNVRRGSASINAPNPLYYSPGENVDVSEVVIGDTIEGNSIWYKGENDLYYWSGGFSELEFVIDPERYKRLNDNEQISVVTTVMNKYLPFLKEKVIGFSGVSVAYKKSKSAGEEAFHGLTVHVEKKSSDADFQIPKFLTYYGLEIPTDVIVCKKATPCFIGNAVYRKDVNVKPSDYGTAGLIVKGTQHDYLLTNFHVVYHDLIKKPQSIVPRTFVFKNNSFPIHVSRSLAHEENVIGDVIAAQLDNLLDIAIVKLNEKGRYRNIFPDGTSLGLLEKSTLLTNGSYKNSFIQKWGATSRNSPKGKIKSLNTVINIYYFGIDKAPLLLSGVIQTTKISDKGDSGSLVYDDNMKLIGILFADDEKDNDDGSEGNSYVLPIDRVFQFTQKFVI